jgi:hypothetical protein
MGENGTGLTLKGFGTIERSDVDLVIFKAFLQDQIGIVTVQARGSQLTADGGDIPHTLGAIPTSVHLTGTVAGEIVTYTAKDATNITVAIKTNLGEPGTTQVIDWGAIL